ncbi:MAG: hypothetical protein FJ290_14785 [Planctomycetes bacterium]|nr:hypothetical protein [Planctomycetota bacterium]
MDRQKGVDGDRVELGLRYATLSRARVIACRAMGLLGRYAEVSVKVDEDGPVVVVGTDRDGANALIYVFSLREPLKCATVARFA